MESLPIAGNACLFMSHLLANNKAAQSIFMTDEMAKCIVFLLNFNELVNKCDPDMPMETLQEIAFYAILAAISFTKNNQTG